MKITFIGAGNMAEAIISGILDKGVSTPDELTVTDLLDERLQYFEEKLGVATSSDNAAAVKDADVVVLAVKPQVFESVWPEIDGALSPDALVVSIMAGITCAGIAHGKNIRVVRIMPNTPALVGWGAAGIAPGAFATEADVEIARTLMRAVGKAVVVREEDMDAVTALSGSGPAYVFYFLEGMLEAAERMGLDREIARKLALAMVAGAAELMRQTGEDADALRRKVTSKGGTTAAAIDVFEKHAVKDSIIEALLAAERRSKELANG